VDEAIRLFATADADARVAVMLLGSMAGRSSMPWFRRRPAIAIIVTVALYIAVFVTRLSVHGTSDPISLLYVLPIALAAFVFGETGGAIGGIAAVSLGAAWDLVDGVHLSAFGWVTRSAAMVLLGVLVGSAVDGLRGAAAAEQRLAAAQLRERQAAEINDTIVQHLVAAKWAIEAGDVPRSIDLLTDGIETAEALVHDLLTQHDDAWIADTNSPRTGASD
jgi:hypothetical protein